jgi:hypothetical protein
VGASFQQEIGRFFDWRTSEYTGLPTTLLKLREANGFSSVSNPLSRAAICFHLLTSPYATMPIIEPKKELFSQGLPVVSAKTVDAIFQVYAGKKWGKHLAELRDRLLQENPRLVKFIENQAGKYPSKLHNAMFEVIMGVISVLDHQAMVDNKGNNPTKLLIRAWWSVRTGPVACAINAKRVRPWPFPKRGAGRSSELSYGSKAHRPYLVDEGMVTLPSPWRAEMIPGHYRH